jgi:hypothetical protein
MSMSIGLGAVEQFVMDAKAAENPKSSENKDN